MRPVYSATGMNSSGGTSPRSGSSQRTSASTPATRAGVLEVEHRLVVQDELLALDRAAQPRGDEQPLERVGRAALVERDAHALGAARLAHRRLGVAQQALGVGGVAGVDARADAGAQLEPLALDLERPARRDDDRPAAVSAVCSAAPSMSASITANSPSPTPATSAVSGSDSRRRRRPRAGPCSRAAWPRPAATRSSPSRPTCSTTTWSSLARAARCAGAGARAGAGGREARDAVAAGVVGEEDAVGAAVDGGGDRVQALAVAVPAPRLADVQLAGLAEQLGAGAVDVHGAAVLGDEDDGGMRSTS